MKIINVDAADKSPYQKLKKLILDRQIKSGTRLTEAFLSEKLNMSRIPTREAIQQLVHEGFIERNGKTGYQIQEYNEQNIIDLHYYREALDGMLTRLFTLRMEVSQLYYLEMNLEAMKEQLLKLNHLAFSEIDAEFHRIIARGARNQYIEHQHEIILEKVLYIADTLFKPNEQKGSKHFKKKDFEETYESHCSIFSAIKERDPDNAEQTARKSVQDGLKKVLQVFSRRH